MTEEGKSAAADVQGKAKQDLHAIYEAANRNQAEQALVRFLAKYEEERDDNRMFGAIVVALGTIIGLTYGILAVGLVGAWAVGTALSVLPGGPWARAAYGIGTATASPSSPARSS